MCTTCDRAPAVGCLRAAPTGTMGNGAAAAGGTVHALGHGLKVQCEQRSKLQEAWMGTTGKVKGVYVHNIGSCVRTGKNPVPDLCSALLDRSALVLELSRGQLGSRGYLARDFLCFKEKEVSYFLAESPSSKNKTKPR